MAKFIRFDDYGFVTYLNLRGYPVKPERKGSEVFFTVSITLQESEKELEVYKKSEFKKFDDSAKLLKRQRNILLDGKSA